MTEQRQFAVFTDPPRPIKQMLSIRVDERSPSGLSAQYRGRWHVVTGPAGQLTLGKEIEGDDDE